LDRIVGMCDVPAECTCGRPNGIPAVGACAEAALSPPTGKVLVKQEFLREIEWITTATRVGIEVCPACGQGKNQMGVHLDDCWLAALLKD